MEATFCDKCKGWVGGALWMYPTLPPCRCQATRIYKFLDPVAQPSQEGWRCPVCGRGNAPFVMQCPCRPTTLGDGPAAGAGPDAKQGGEAGQ